MQRFNFKNIKENTERLVGLHKAIGNYQKMKQQEAAKQGVILPDVLNFDIDKARRALRRKVDKYYANPI